MTVAFFGALAWLVWTLVHQHTQSACFAYSHYVSSAVLALVFVTAADVTVSLFMTAAFNDDAERQGLVSGLVLEGAGTAFLVAIGLTGAAYFSAIVSCSGG